MSSAGLEVRDASLTIDGVRILDGVSLSVTPGKLYGLIGPNGAGKSTLMHAVLGLVPLDSGSVRFDGADLLAMPRRDRARLAALVEQTGTTESQLDATEIVMLGRIPFQSMWQADASEADREAVAEALEQVGMTAHARRKYHTLSGGEKQRLHIARALAQQPRLLVLDEPTNHLDLHAQLSVLGLLAKKARAGLTVLVALHDLNLAASFCDELIVLHRGRQFDCGQPKSILTKSLISSVYGVSADVLSHPGTGRPLIAFEAPE